MSASRLSLSRAPGRSGGIARRARSLGASLLVLLALGGSGVARAEVNALVLQTDFGVKDGAVAAMKGVAISVARELPVHDLTHEITPYDIWEAAYRLHQAASYWPAGTVFVSVVDPGVGTERAAVVLRTKTGHLFVSPDNGSLTLVAEQLGIDAVRRIDERLHRLPGSEKSHTFHGRDLFAFTGARLAAGVIPFEAVGPLQPPEVVRIPYTAARIVEGEIVGGIPALDPNFGNVWTNVPEALLDELGIRRGDSVRVTLRRGSVEVYRGTVPLVATFGDVPAGEPLLYVNSLLQVALGLNQASFAERYDVRAGSEWTVTLRKVR